MSLSEELSWRGFVNQTTLEDISALDKTKRTLYWGVDPSAPSMQIGNLAAAMMVRVFIKHGYDAVLLVGGATGLIGDPDGKAEERNLKTPDEIAANKQAIVKQYKTIFGDQTFRVVDNYDWFKGIGYLEFLRDVGKHVPMRQMLGRDFVQSRLSEGGAGISYAEFSYALIQGYDFLHLHKEHGVTLQVAASDQWGNSIAGVELIRRITGKQAHVWTTPLIINRSTGKKFGKSEDGAVWLSAELTSAYQFYQFWLNVDDEGVTEYLKVYTELGKSELDEVIKQFEADKSKRFAQKTLAYEVTKLVHGEKRAGSVRRVSEVLFGGSDYKMLEQDDFEILAVELPMLQINKDSDLVELLVKAGLAGSNGEARRFIEQGAVYVNSKSVSQDNKLTEKDTIDGTHAIMRRGKNSFALLKLK